MKKSETPMLTHEEPLGIIISRGAVADEAPAMFAYIYSDAPEPDDQPLAAAV